MRAAKPNEKTKPFDGQFYIAPMWYKIGVHSRVFIWTGENWIRSTMNNELLEAEVLMQTIKAKQVDGRSFLKRINESLTVNERNAIVFRIVYQKSLQDIATLIMVCPSRVPKYITEASDKLTY